MYIPPLPLCFVQCFQPFLRFQTKQHGLSCVPDNLLAQADYDQSCDESWDNFLILIKQNEGSTGQHGIVNIHTVGQIHTGVLCHPPLHQIIAVLHNFYVCLPEEEEERDPYFHWCFSVDE